MEFEEHSRTASDEIFVGGLGGRASRCARTAAETQLRSTVEAQSQPFYALPPDSELLLQWRESVERRISGLEKAPSADSGMRSQ